MLSVIADATARAEQHTDLDELAREGARRMPAAALEAEVDAYLAAYGAERDEQGRRLVVRNGHARQREVLTAAGAVAVQAPRVNDRRVDPVTGQRARFRSVLLPPWCRKSPKVAEVLPLLYLHGLSTGDFVAALEAFFGSGAGLSAPVITRLVAAWQADYQVFWQRDLSDTVAPNRIRRRDTAMQQRLSLITLGVRDVSRAQAFYEALGWRLDGGVDDETDHVAFFQLGGFILALWGRGKLERDSGVEDSGGWGGVTLAHNVRSPEEVDAVLAEARDAGATIARAGAATFWGGYSGVFIDPDGHPWEVAHNPAWTVHEDGRTTLD